MNPHPRSVRNFWLELDIDGRQEVVATGPKGKDGGFKLVIKQRDLGRVTTAFTIEGKVRDSDDRLVCSVWQGEKEEDYARLQNHTDRN